MMAEKVGWLFMVGNIVKLFLQLSFFCENKWWLSQFLDNDLRILCSWKWQIYRFHRQLLCKFLQICLSLCFNLYFICFICQLLYRKKMSQILQGRVEPQSHTNIPSSVHSLPHLDHPYVLRLKKSVILLVNFSISFSWQKKCYYYL